MQKKFQEIEDFYQNKYNEDGRMNRQPLEFLRCKEIISRYLNNNMEIADIGGATGVFSYWLAQQGHSVHLLDYTPLHIEQAKENSKKHKIELSSYTCGDARQVPFKNNQFDLVLEMGPLYHLQDEEDRMLCLSEAMRILKDNGIIICEAISRYANLLEGFQYFLIDDEQFVKIIDENLTSGKHIPGETTYFTTAFFHTPELIIEELKRAGFTDISLIPVEGFAQILDVNDLFNNQQRKELLLKYIKETENISSLLGVSGHFIAVGVKQTV